MGQSWRQKLTFFGSSSLWNLQETTFHTPPLGDAEHVIKEGTRTQYLISRVSLKFATHLIEAAFGIIIIKGHITQRLLRCVSFRFHGHLHSHRRPGDEELDGGRIEVDFVQ